MYLIKTDAGNYYADTVYPVTVADNGCYIIDDEATGGIVAKLYDGERMADKVFRLRDDALHGTESLCTYEAVSGAEALAQYKAALHELGVETEESV